MRRSTRAVTFQSILCPVDFSQHSREALRYAAGIANRSGGRLTVLFVNDPLLVAAAAAAFHRRRQFLAQSQAELARFVTQAIRGGPAPREEPACLVSTGNPADEILHTVERLESDLVVIGTHGLSGVNRLFFGSTTEHVLRRVETPVLAIPPLKRRRKGTGERAGSLAIARVVAPIDFAGEWEPEAGCAADVARWLDAELLLVHVIPRTQMPPWLRLSGAAAHDRRRVDKAARALERVRTRLFSDLKSASSVLTGNPADEIARLVADGPPTLVAMALRDDGGWRPRRGAIAYHVLSHAARPVLALPGRRRTRRVASRRVG